MLHPRKFNESPVSKILLIVLLFTSILTHGQNTGTISGQVSDQEGTALPLASVTVESLNKGVVADENGAYSITKVPTGTYRVTAVMIGYTKQTKDVTLGAGKTAKVNFALNDDTHELEEVTVTGDKSDVQKLRDQSLTVSSIDVVPMQNLNLDVNTVLNRSTGIRIRQQGGLGSDFSFSLNGFTGNQVRFFIDGISADFLGPAMRFNNIPVNIIERIEVYKGVVPINLGADALGGAVNIVTSDNAKDFLDVSYSYGSFNTHQAAASSRVTLKNNFIVNASAFYNYSDNNYPINVQTADPVSGKLSPVQPYKLFNEQYRSSSGWVEAGVVNKKWADRFLVGLIASENKQNRQRGRAMVLNPAGEVYTTSEGYTPSIKYQKRDLGVKNLSLNFSGVYSSMQTMNVDTSSRIYSWDRSFTRRQFGSTAGELNWYKTMFRFNDRAVFATATVEYTFADKHTFTFNNTYSYFRRKGSDPVASQYSESIAFEEPNTLQKNFTGLSYRLGLFDNRWRTLVFVKLFNMTANLQQEEGDTGIYTNVTNKKAEHGEGIASSFFVTKELQLKASYEHTSRLPENYEMFGDGLLQLPNIALQPEKSHNMNFEILYSKRLTDDHTLGVEGGFVYRLPENIIRNVAVGVLSQYQNLARARVLGAETSLRYSYRRRINVELNGTYQDIRNNNKEINSYPDPLYLDRIPNTPYLFGNAMVGILSPRKGESQWQVGFNWATMFVQSFYLQWPSQGSSGGKFDIPQQLSHDASVTLSALAGKYNLSFSCINLADANLYDNYKVQKPGRSFNVKLRFYISKFRD